jgi:hypothetical protein
LVGSTATSALKMETSVFLGDVGITSQHGVKTQKTNFVIFILIAVRMSNLE